MIPYGRQTIEEDDIEAVVRVLRSDWLTQGPAVAAFEEALAGYVGARFAVAFSSGTAALHAAYAAIGLGPGDEIVTSPNTFAATANAALFLGGRPVFGDVDPATGILDLAAAEAAITPRTRAIVPVSFAGHPMDNNGFRRLADRHGLVFIEDGCHALGARNHGRPVGSLAEMTVFSFHPVKSIATGEGGAVTTDSPERYRQLVQFRNHGVTKNPELLTRDEGPWYYEMQGLGPNYRITDIQCALGLSQLGKLERFVARRREIAARYGEALGDLAALALPRENPEMASAWHLYVIKLSDPWGDRRREVVTALAERGVGTQVHYLPVYRHPYYQANGWGAVRCPHAEDHYRRALSLPLFPGMTDEQLARVITAVRDVLGGDGL